MSPALPTDASPARAELLGLLQCAREAPEDATPRLILADWLEEYGDEAEQARAELIHLQCQPDAWNGQETPADSARRIGRQDQLQTRYAAAWLGPLRSLPLPWEFRRGMLEVELDAREVKGRRLEQFSGSEAWAWVEGVTLHGLTSPRLGELAGNPAWLSSVTTLRLVGEVRRTDMRALARMKWFGDLRRLDLEQTRIAEDAVAVLAEVPPGNLGQLSFSRSGLTTRAAGYLSRSSGLAGLTALDLRHNRLGDVAIEALLANLSLDRLTRLLLAGNGLGPRAVRTLLACPSLHRLVDLDLSSNPLGPEGARLLANSPGLAHLTTLKLSRCRLSAEAVEAVLLSPHLRKLARLSLAENEIAQFPLLREDAFPPSLRALDLSGNGLEECDFARLAVIPSGEQVQALSLGGDGLTAAAVEVLAHSLLVANLTELDLAGSNLGCEGLANLCRWPGLDHLESLGLDDCDLDSRAIQTLGARGCAKLASATLAGNHLDAEGAEALARGPAPGGPGLATLCRLDLDGNPLGDAGAVALVKSPALPRLAILSLSDCDMTDAGVTALARSPGLARISRLRLGGPDLGPDSARALIGSPYTTALQSLDLAAAIPQPHLRLALQQQFRCSPVCRAQDGA